MTKDSFISVVMGFTGKQAALAARTYIKTSARIKSGH
jgi:hypothetical protein